MKKLKAAIESIKIKEKLASAATRKAKKLLDDFDKAYEIAEQNATDNKGIDLMAEVFDKLIQVLNTLNK